MKGISPFISAKGASPQIKGSIIYCTLKHQHGVKDEIYPDHVLSFEDEEDFVYVDITCDLYGGDQEAGNAKVLCLLIGTTGILSHLPYRETSVACIV
jgi:hypothetical protein